MKIITGTIPVRVRINRRGPGFTYADKAGLSILKDTKFKFRFINGIYLRTNKNFRYITFRNHFSL